MPSTATAGGTIAAWRPCTGSMTGSGRMGMAAPSPDGVSRPCADRPGPIVPSHRAEGLGALLGRLPPALPSPFLHSRLRGGGLGRAPPAAWGLRLRKPLRLAGLWRLLRLPRPGLRLGVHAGPCDVRALAPGVHGRDPERNEA